MREFILPNHSPPSKEARLGTRQELGGRRLPFTDLLLIVYSTFLVLPNKRRSKGYELERKKSNFRYLLMI